MLTATKNNPVGRLAAKYETLMAENDTETLIEMIQDCVDGTGFSPKNRARHERTMKRIGDDLFGLKQYVTNFMLAADGLATIK
jgi:hypothetical protein